MKLVLEQILEEEVMGEVFVKVVVEYGDDVLYIVVVFVYVMFKMLNVFLIVGGCKVEYLKDNIWVLSLYLIEE